MDIFDLFFDLSDWISFFGLLVILVSAACGCGVYFLLISMGTEPTMAIAGGAGVGLMIFTTWGLLSLLRR